MPLLRKQPFVKSQPPAGLKPEDEVFFCETTKEVFLDYEAFFERTILCNSLVWSCSVTGKSNLTYEEAAESEAKSRKKISNLPKGLKKGLLYLVSRYLALPWHHITPWLNRISLDDSFALQDSSRSAGRSCGRRLRLGQVSVLQRRNC